MLRGLGDARMAERADDLRDVEERVLAALAGRSEAARTLPKGAVLVAEDLLPSQVAGLAAGRIAGICTSGGDDLARRDPGCSMGVPGLWRWAPCASDADGEALILDADRGELQVEPPWETPRRDGPLSARTRRAEADLGRGPRSRTTDGLRIEVLANLGGAPMSPGRWRRARRAAACSVPSSCSWTAPRRRTEEEQRLNTRRSPWPGPSAAVVRTLDAGATSRSPT